MARKKQTARKSTWKGKLPHEVWPQWVQQVKQPVAIEWTTEMVCHIACQAECQSFSFKEKREERPLCDKCAEECDTKMKGPYHKKTVHSF